MIEALLDRESDPFGNPICLLDCVELAHDHELVAADARRDVALTDAGAQLLGNVNQHVVARGVTELVVDRLEVVEVDEQRRTRPRRATPQRVVEVLESAARFGRPVRSS